MAFFALHFVILAALKSDSCRVLKSSTQGSWLHVNSTFLQHKNVILQGSSCFRSVTLRRFETLK